MWDVITKLAVNCKSNVQLIKMVNFKAAIDFIKTFQIYIQSYIENFLIFPRERSCRNLISLCK